MKKIVLLCSSLLLLGTSIFAQWDPVPFVDIAQAEAEIKEIDVSINTYTAEFDKIKAENDDLKKQYASVQDDQKSISGAFEEARNQRFRLEANLALIVDKELRAKVLESIQKASEVINSGGLKISANDRSSKEILDKIKDSKYRMDVTATIISRKKDRKAFLEAAIEKTKRQIEIFTRQMNELDSFFTSNEAQRLRVETKL
jgi:chromosome segregation ATPase